MQCPSCSRENRAGARFCDACGLALVAFDGAQPSPDAYTPRRTAEQILRTRSALEGERKQVTVLFADVKGSMELAEQVDPEEWHRILDRFFHILAGGVHRFEGTVNQYTGDGIMALFGAPIAHEDHALRACHAALRLLDDVRAYARDVKRAHGLDFAMRVGLHSGDVVVGSIGDDLRMDYTAQGHTVGLAQRMESLAEPNACFVTGTTAALAAGYFALDDLGAFRVKGVAEPVPVFVLRGLGTVRTRFDASRARGLSRFVGRDADMEVLEAALARARAGDGQVVGVVAEAGTGKSRLCFEFVERCRARGLGVFEGHAVAHGRSIPLLPILQVFRSYYGIAEQDDDRTVREKIAGRLLLLDESFREALPVMFEHLGVPDPDRPAPRMDPEAKQRQILAVLRRLVRGADARGGQFMALIEDLHWLDAASEAFLAQWVDAVAGTNAFLLVNFRPGYAAEWMQRPHYRRLPLAPLDPDAVRALLDGVLGSDPSVAGLADAIHARTAGNPFFAEEIVQSLVESGQLDGMPGSYRLATAVATLAIPPSVQALLAARIDRLPEREKRVLQVAAVIGKDFAESVLARVVELPAAELAAALGALTQAGFVVEGTSVAEYAFRHPLTQEVALATQLRARRAAHHAAVARALEALHATKLDEQAALVALHWEEAGEALVAAGWHRRAADHISGRDVAAGRRHWQRVRDLTAAREDDAGAAPLALEACIGLLGVGFRLGVSAELDELYASGRRWVERVGSLEAAVRLEGLASTRYIAVGDCVGAQRHARAGERLVDASTDPILRALGRFPTAYLWFITGPLDLACRRLDEIIPIARDHDFPAVFGGEGMLVASLQLRAGLEADTGDVARAYAMADEAIQVARARGLMEAEGWACGTYANTEWLDGDVERALPHCRRALEIAERIGSAFSIAWALDSLATVLAHAKRPEALDVAERCLAVSREQRTSLEGEACHLMALAECCTAAGDATRACALAAEALQVAERQGTWRYGVRAALALARALLATGDASHASRIRAALDRTEEIARAIVAPNHVPLVQLERAALAALEGDPVARTTHLRQARDGFARMGAEARVAQVDGWLAR
jgi:class 3 adenylate cyclase/tetratricopeptide (TPR) repeat protein